MASQNEESPQGDASYSSPIRPGSRQYHSYQDEAASLDSRLKAVWDQRIGASKNVRTLYCKAVVLLLSWDTSIDDMGTQDEVSKLEAVFKEKFFYNTVQKVITKSGRTPQSQVNLYLSEFVHEYEAEDTLLIVYYAGHGRPGEKKGELRLAGDRKQMPEDSRYHEIVWTSADHNIKDLISDVLVIFDCCYAGELEKSIRSPEFGRRAFEYLAATSAKSTTKTPGPKSFTTALIWALEDLSNKKPQFTTQELVRHVFQAPNFPEEQAPRLSERGDPCERRIVLQRLEENHHDQPIGFQSQIHEKSIGTYLNLRLVFQNRLTVDKVEKLAIGMKTLIHGGDYDLSTILWEGMETKVPIWISAKVVLCGQKWLGRIRNKSIGASVEDSPPPRSPASESLDDDDLSPTPDRVTDIFVKSSLSSGCSSTGNVSESGDIGKTVDQVMLQKQQLSQDMQPGKRKRAEDTKNKEALPNLERVPKRLKRETRNAAKKS